VEAHVRTDLEDTDPSCRSTFRCKQPPADIRDDPGRLAVWRATVAREAETDRIGARQDGPTVGPVYVVSGCGELRLYVRWGLEWMPLDEARW
jgi:hypothetical protein